MSQRIHERLFVFPHIYHMPRLRSKVSQDTDGVNIFQPCLHEVVEVNLFSSIPAAPWTNWASESTRPSTFVMNSLSSGLKPVAEDASASRFTQR